MKIDSVLKKEGVNVISQLDTLQVNSIAKSISSKLCLAFPEHNLNRSDIFSSLCRLNMFIADMGSDLAYAKYYYRNNSIYFNKNIDFEKLSDVAIHECLHYLQEIRDERDNLTRMGLYDSGFGLALNEATVQLMASEANMSEEVTEKYFNITLKTNSPNYYPLECALVKQISYFTGTYPLYHSTFNSNDVFKNTFTVKTNKKTYDVVSKNLDQLLREESELQYFINELHYTERASTIKVLNKLIRERKASIASTFFSTQNLIMKTFFISEFNAIRDLNDIKEFKDRFYNYSSLLGSSETYTFYNTFYRDMMDLLEKKREYITVNGEINLFETAQNSVMIIDNTKNSFTFLMVFFRKVKKLFDSSKEVTRVNDLY